MTNAPPTDRALGREFPVEVSAVFGDLHFALDNDLLALGVAPGGEVLALEEDGGLLVFHGASGQLLRTWKIDDAEAAWQFSPDGRWLIGAGESLLVYSLAGEPRLAASEPIDGATAMAITPQNDVVAVGCVDGSIHLFSLPTARRIAVLPHDVDGIGAPSKFGVEVSALAFSVSGTFLAAAGEDRRMCVWDWRRPERIIQWAGHTDRVDAIAWSPDDSRIGTATWDSSVRIWDARSGELSAMLNGHADRVHRVAFLPVAAGAPLLASGDSDGFVRYWNYQTLEVVGAGRAGTNVVRCLHAGRDGLIVGGTDQRLHRIPLAGRSPLLQTVPATPVQALAVGVDEVAVLHRSGELKFWPSLHSEGTEPTSLGSGISALAGGPSTAAVAFHSSVGWAVGFFDGSLATIDSKSKRSLIEWKSAENRVTHLAFSSDGRRIAAAHQNDAALRIWNAGTGRLEVVAPECAFGGSIEHIAYHPHEHLLAVSGANWEESTTRDIEAPRLKTSDWDRYQPPVGVRLVRDRRVHQPEGCVVLWDVQNWAVRQVLEGGARKATFHPRGLNLAVLSVDGALLVWDYAGAKLLQEFGRARLPIVDFAYHPSGRWIVAVEASGRLSLFDVDRGRDHKSIDLGVRPTSTAMSSTGDYCLVGTASSVCCVVDLSDWIESSSTR